MLELPAINPAFVTYVFSGATTVVCLPENNSSLKIVFETSLPMKESYFRIEDDNSKFGNILFLTNCELEEKQELNLDFKPGDGGRYILNLRLIWDTTYMMILQKVH